MLEGKAHGHRRPREARPGGREQIQSVLPVNGYLSQGDDRLHFGVGAAEKVDLVEITWPDGKKQEMRDLKVDRGGQGRSGVNAQ